MANIATKGSGTIDRRADEVWDFIADPATLYRWVKDINKPGSWIDGGTPEVVGSRYRIEYDYGRKSNDITFEVTTSIPGRAFSVNTVEGPYPITADYTFAESADGNSTRVSFAMTARSDSKFTAVLFVLTGWFAKYFMRRMLNKELVELQNTMNALQAEKVDS